MKSKQIIKFTIKIKNNEVQLNRVLYKKKKELL